jgi:hypothetical protein
MRTAKLPFLTCLIVLASVFNALRAESPAPLHLSLTEANHNRERGRLLLTVRVQTADLEAVLSERAKHKVTAAEPGELAPLALEYVREKLRLTSPKGEALRLEWAGHDVADKQLFLFFEAPLNSSLQGLRIANTLLLEHLPDQINSVELHEGAIKQTLVFSRETTELTVNAKP